MNGLPEFLRNENVSILNPTEVLRKLQKIKDGGVEGLTVISDFDATMSKHHDSDGKRLPTTYCVLENDTGLPQENVDMFKANFAKYYPIEMDPTVPDDKKIEAMLSWWKATMDAAVCSGILTKDLLVKSVIDSNLTLRDNTDKMLQFCTAQRIPFLIFSAGCGDIIDIALRHKYQPVLWSDDNMMIVSNRLGFDETGKLVNFLEPAIHTLNKKNLMKLAKEFNTPGSQAMEAAVASRKNILLMGDHLGDINMSEGTDSAANILSIGFLNYKFDNLEIYRQKFDIVLVND